MQCIDLLGPCTLGDLVSSPRCPALRTLTLHGVQGVGNFAIHSDSLLEIDLMDLQLGPDDALGVANFTVHSESLEQLMLIALQGLQQLNVIAPALKLLRVSSCFAPTGNQPVANISAPQLESLRWGDSYDPSSTHFGNIENLQSLGTYPFFVYGDHAEKYNSYCLKLLQCFDLVRSLRLTLAYMSDITNRFYLMEDITRLPDITHMTLEILTEGHSFGASVFHILRMCNGVRKLVFTFLAGTSRPKCPSGCVCDQPPNWKTEKLALNYLKEVQVLNLRGTDHEAGFVKRLFDWATVLETMTVTFHRSVAGNKAKEFCQMLQSFSRPEICLKGPHFA